MHAPGDYTVQSTAMPAAAEPETSTLTARPRWRTVLMGGAAALGMILASLDFSVNVALPAIRDAFDTDLAAVQWVIVVFIATRAGLALGARRLRRPFRPADGLPVRHRNLPHRHVVPDAVADAGSHGRFSERCRPWAPAACTAPRQPSRHSSSQTTAVGLSMGFTSASLAFGMVASTLAAGPLVQIYGWQAVYAGRVPLTALALAAGLLAVPGRLSPQASNRRFDILGAALVLALLLCLIIGLRLGQSIGWTSPIVIALLALTPVVLAALIRTETRAQSPVLPGALLRLPAFQTATSVMFLGHFSQFVIWFIFPFYITDSLNRGPVTLGIMLATLSACNIVSAPIGRLALRPVGCASGGRVGIDQRCRGTLRDVGPKFRLRDLAPGGHHRRGWIGRRMVPVGGLCPDAGQRAGRPLRHRIRRNVAGAGFGNRVLRRRRRSHIRRPQRPVCP